MKKVLIFSMCFGDLFRYRVRSHLKKKKKKNLKAALIYLTVKRAQSYTWDLIPIIILLF